MKNLIRYLVLLLILQFGVSNLYADDDVTPQLIRHQESGINYLNGGVGDEQRNELKEARKDFNLQLTFAEKQSGRFIADVDIDIQTMSGKEVLQLSDMGPIFMAQLPAGKYRIKATSGDQTQTKTIQVNKRGIRELYFYWY
jgi:hypothetical protein